MADSEAATKIQAVFRGKMARRQSDLMREHIADKFADAQAVPAEQHDAGRRTASATPTMRGRGHEKKTRAPHDLSQVDQQYNSVAMRVKNVPRRTDNENRLWEAVEKLNDLGQVQRAHISHLTKGQGRFQYKYDSKETKIIEEKFLALKKKETESLEKRKREFERLIEEHAETMNTVRTQLLESQTKTRDLEHSLEDESLQKKHAKDAYSEVQAWLDDANKQIKGLQDEILAAEEAKRALDDSTRDMATKIENFQNDIRVRDTMVRDETARATRAKDELNNAQRVLSEEKDHTHRLTDTLDSNAKEADAKHARLTLEISHLRAELEVLIERTKRWESFDKLCPDYDALVSQLEAKDVVIHKAKQIVSVKHSDEIALQKKLRAAESCVQEKVTELTELEDTLETIVSPDDTDVVGTVCVDNTLVACYPDPCPVGQELHLVVTTCDSTRQPVRGVHKEEFKVQQVTFPPTGGCVIGQDFLIEDVLNRDRASSCFHSSYLTPAEGRSGFRVLFRGHTFLTTSHVPIPSPASVDAVEFEERKPRFTVSCTPNIVAVGETMDVTIVVREPGTLLPARECIIPVDQFKVTAYTTAQGLKLVNPLQQIRGTPVYHTRVAVEGVTAQGTPRDYIGLEVMLKGGTDASRGSSKLIADSRNDKEWDPNSTTVYCTPDPAVEGEEVRVYVTARNSYWVPLPANAEHPAPTPQFTPKGSTTLLEQPELAEGASQVFVGRFIPAEAGRCGVSVTMGGVEIGSGTVHVSRPEPVDPTQTILKVEPSVVPAGETIHISLVTCDADGRATPGPEPTAFRLTPLGTSGTLLPLRRVEGDESHYVTTLRTSKESTHTTAGVTVDFEGKTLAKKVRVSAEPLDIPGEVVPQEDKAHPVPKFCVRFTQDPVVPGAIIPVMVCVNSDDPSQDRRRRDMKMPELKAMVNCEVVEGVKPVPGARYVWRALVRMGNLFGTSSADVFVDNRLYTASTTVDGDSIESLGTQIRRLKTLEVGMRDVLREVEERKRDLDDRARSLDEREADIHAREEDLNERTAVRQVDEIPQHILFGLHLSDGIQYGYQWDAVDGAKVVEVLDDGPVAQLEQRIQPGDVLKEVKYTDIHGCIHTCPVRQMDDFRRVARMLSKPGPAPEVTLTFYQTQSDEFVTVRVLPSSSPTPPGRSVGTVRHPCRTMDTSLCAISPGRSSVRSRN